MSWSEERLLRWLATRRPRARSARVGAFGSDAAVVRLPARERVVTCTDQTIAGVHYAPGTPAHAVGRKAAGRALSDLAATAARPTGLLLALRAPRTTAESWIRNAIRAVARAAERYGAELLGGDLACAPGPAALTVTAFGHITSRRRPPSRDRARPGQVVLLTGPTGGSGLGRHLRLEPRLDEGRWLFAAGAVAMIDVSDGLALDLSRLARASGVRIDLEEVPVHADARRLAQRTGRRPREHALVDGEDHELVATLTVGAWRRVQAEARRRFPRLSVVGRVRAGRGLWVRSVREGSLERWRGAGGWIHGS